MKFVGWEIVTSSLGTERVTQVLRSLLGEFNRRLIHTHTELSMLPLSFECQNWLEEQELRNCSFGKRELEALCKRMYSLGSDLDWDALRIHPAAEHEERLWLLAQIGNDGPALYLVSDGPGVTSAAHSHETWALIVGLAGIERNSLYRLISEEMREVCRDQVVDLGAGEYLYLAADSVHSTDVVGTKATFHLHLYGKLLNRLPSFEARRFQVVADEP